MVLKLKHTGFFPLAIILGLIAAVTFMSTRDIVASGFLFILCVGGLYADFYMIKKKEKN